MMMMSRWRLEVEQIIVITDNIYLEMTAYDLVITI